MQRTIRLDPARPFDNLAGAVLQPTLLRRLAPRLVWQSGVRGSIGHLDACEILAVTAIAEIGGPPVRSNNSMDSLLGVSEEDRSVRFVHRFEFRGSVLEREVALLIELEFTL